MYEWSDFIWSQFDMEFYYIFMFDHSIQWFEAYIYSFILMTIFYALIISLTIIKFCSKFCCNCVLKFFSYIAYFLASLIFYIFSIAF